MPYLSLYFTFFSSLTFLYLIFRYFIFFFINLAFVWHFLKFLNLISMISFLFFLNMSSNSNYFVLLICYLYHDIVIYIMFLEHFFLGQINRFSFSFILSLWNVTCDVLFFFYLRLDIGTSDGSKFALYNSTRRIPRVPFDSPIRTVRNFENSTNHCHAKRIFTIDTEYRILGGGSSVASIILYLNMSPIVASGVAYEA